MKWPGHVAMMAELGCDLQLGGEGETFLLTSYSSPSTRRRLSGSLDDG
jgi:hypothetical protein